MKKLKKIIIGLGIFLNLTPVLNGKTVEYKSPKESFRTTWVASVENMNYPKVENINGERRIRNTEEELKKDWLEILDTHEKMNFNAVIYQVSPTLDALYKSENRPWSHVLTGVQGVAPNWEKRFDLVQWMIEETHKRGMEFHAWFNPYRVTQKSQKSATKAELLKNLAEDNFARKNPETVYLFDGKLYLNPGDDKVVNHINRTVEEFLNKYDIDAIHFDDYFYPYKSKKNGKDFYFGDDYEDKLTFKKNSRGFKYIDKLDTLEKKSTYKKEVENWRVNNINRMVLGVKSVIDNYNKENKTSVQWGISPFGIWGHEDEEKGGSKTPIKSTSSKRDIYADTKKWVKNNEIDYIIPQVYWEFDMEAAPYGVITKWWADTMKKSRTHLYIGHSSYKHMFAPKNKNWLNTDEIPSQLRFNNKFPKIKGTVLFGYNDIIYDGIKKDVGTVARDKHIKILESEYFNKKALVPPKPWLDKKITKDIDEIRLTLDKNNNYILQFKDPIDNDTRFYVVYTDSNKKMNLDDPKNILKIVGRDKKSENQKINISRSELKNAKYIGVTIKDKAGVESKVKVISKD